MATVSLIPSTSEVAGDFHTSSAASFLLGEMSRNPQDNVLAEAVALLQYVRHTHHLPNFAAAIRQLGIEAGYKKVQPQQHHTGHPHAPFSRTDAIAAHQKIIRGQHASIVQLKHQVAVLGNCVQDLASVATQHSNGNSVPPEVATILVKCNSAMSRPPSNHTAHVASTSAQMIQQQAHPRQPQNHHKTHPMLPPASRPVVARQQLQGIIEAPKVTPEKATTPVAPRVTSGSLPGLIVPLPESSSPTSQQQRADVNNKNGLESLFAATDMQAAGEHATDDDEEEATPSTSPTQKKKRSRPSSPSLPAHIGVEVADMAGGSKRAKTIASTR